MTNIQVRCTLKAANGLAEDNCINTFAVAGADPGADDTQIWDAFNSFYNDVHAPGVLSIASYLNHTIQRVNGLLVELIDEPINPPNVPYNSQSFDLDNVPGNTVPLPQEVAICLSMAAADYFDGVNTGRKRGRVYIGPLSSNASLGVSSPDPARPGISVREALEGAGRQLRDDLKVVDPFRYLAIWSRTDDLHREVSGGWVDDEWDTQRRRGRKRTGRQIWG
jgi:hypothetical protein